MILCDAGPLIALIDPRDANHPRCWEALDAIPNQDLATTIACLTEAYHLLGRKRGALAQVSLSDLVISEQLMIAGIDPGDFPRIREYMTRYASLPMDFADATLVVVAERLAITEVVTLDRHFRVYRPSHCNTFTVIP